MAEVNYGPLGGLIGEWEGHKGLDVSPEPNGKEDTPYTESITFFPAGTAKNAGRQTLAVIQYTQVVRRQDNNAVFHHQVGYWMWDEMANIVMQSLTIPRAVAVLAGGIYEHQGEGVVLKVEAGADQPDWGVVQSPFMQENAKTTVYKHQLSLLGDCLEYEQSTIVDIYGRVFDHTDCNTLVRI